MKPPPFAYAAPGSVEEALSLLAAHGGDARVLAGGQSLMPLLALRMVRPEVIVDIGRIPGLDAWAAEGGLVSLGPMVGQAALLQDKALAAALPLCTMAAPWIGHPSTRSRGTIVGSLCHADPAAELGVCLLTLGAEMTVSSASGDRTIAAADFFDSPLSTAAGEGEMVTAIRVPAAAPRTGYAFVELARRHGDFAIVAAAAVVTLGAAGAVESARVGLGGVADTPVAFDVAGGLEDWADAARDIAARLDPPDDLQASAGYRRDMAARLAAQTLADAAARAAEAPHG